MPDTLALDRRQLLAVAGAAMVPAIAAAQTAPGFDTVAAIPGGVRLTQDNLDIVMTLSAAATLSVVKTRRDYTGDRDGFFLKGRKLAKTRLAKTGTGYELTGAGHTLHIDAKAGAIHLLGSDGGVLFSDLGGTTWSPAADTPLSQRFTLRTTGPLFGLGQFRDPVTDWRNRSVYLAHANMDVALPLLLSPPGFGLLWDTNTHARFTSSGQDLRYDCPQGEVIRYHVFTGATPDAVIAGYRRLTGAAPLLGKWAYGFWQSQLGWWKQGDLEGIVDGYRSRGLPLDIVVQDATYWGSGERWFPNWSGMIWDAQDFPSPKAMCDRAHGQHVHVVASIWPTIGAGTELYRELDAQDLLFNGETWSGGRVLDITAPKARDIYWRHIKSGMMAVGLDGLWTDANEPEFMTAATRHVTARTFAGQGSEAAGPVKDNLLTFSYYQTRLLYQEQVKAYPERRPVTLTRKAHAGQQAFNTVLWSGDLTASWQTLYNQAINLQQMALAGWPYWTNDSGGFFVASRFPDALNDPAYKELYVRWFQFSAFLPVFRAHGYDIRRELWAFGGDGDPVYEALKAALERRYSLMLYIYAQAAKVTFDNASFVRPLAMDYGHDPMVRDYSAQYLFGRDLLVAPVTTPFEHTPQNPKDFVRNDAVSGDLDGVSRIEFYDGVDFGGLVDAFPTDSLSIGGQGDLPPSLRDKPYSLRWTGRITAPDSGVYNVTVSSQGTTRVVIDGKVVMAVTAAAPDLSGVNLKDPTQAPPPPTVTTFDLTLEAGRAYDFEVSQSQPLPGLVGFDLQWQTPAQRANHALTSDKTMAVYLPKGDDWYALGSAKRLSGGQVLNLRPPLGEMPVYVRAGAILPQTPGILYAGEAPKQVELHVHAGADGMFELYDDAGDGLAYAKGACSRRKLAWNDAARTLTIGRARGRYPGQPGATIFAVILYDGETSVPRIVTVPIHLARTIRF